MKMLRLFILLSCPFLLHAQLQGSHSKIIFDQGSESQMAAFKSVVVDRNGFFWMGTEMGLYQYDGQSITKVVDRQFPEISKGRIVKLAVDDISGDVIFVVYGSTTLYSIHDGVIKKLDSVRQFMFSNSKTCFINNTKYRSEMLRYLFKYNIKQDDFRNQEQSVVENDKYLFVLLYSKMLFVFNKKGGIVDRVTYDDKTEILKIRNTILLVYKDTVCRVLIDHGKIKTVPVKTDAYIEKVLRKIAIYKGVRFDQFFKYINGDYVLNYEGPIYRLDFRNNKLEKELFLKNKKNEVIQFQFFKKEGVCIKATLSKNIELISFPKFNTIAFDDQEKNNCYGVAAINKNTWFSTSGWKFKNNTLRSFNFNCVKKSFILPYKKTYYYCNNRYFYNAETNEEITSDLLIRSLKPCEISSFALYKNNLWLADPTRLVYLEKHHFVVDTFFSKRFKHNVLFQVYSYHNNLLLCTLKGVYYYKPFSELKLIKGLGNIYARYYKAIDKNSFWIGCYGDGLFLVQNGKVYPVRDLNADMSATHALEEDGDGNLWISTNDGLLTVDKKRAIKNILAHRPIDCYRFTTHDGLSTNEFNGGGTHSSLKDSTGVLGFTSMNGFVWFHPKEVRKHLFSSRVIVDKVTVDGAEIPEENKRFVIPAEAEIIYFSYNYAYYYNRENITEEYRFSDETKWRKVINTNNFQIARTKSGSRKLFIRIHTHGFDHKYDVIKTVFVDFEARNYETVWFWVVCGILFLLFIYLSFQIGSMRNKRRELILEEKVRLKTVELQNTASNLAISREEIIKSLKEKEILIKEIHHRVKNNLQLVITLLSYQSSRFQSKELNDFLENGAGRIVSMALIHENLYQSENLGYIDFKEYVHSLVQNIIRSMADDQDVHYAIDVDQIILDIRVAIPLGLITNELIVNTIKHNYTQGNELKFSLSLHEVGPKHYNLIYKDPQSTMTAEESSRKGSFGLELIQLLTSQLKGKCTFEFSAGLDVTIDFKIKEI